MQFIQSVGIKASATMLLVICHALLFDGYVSGQATCSSPTLVSGFGVDGDVHANTPSSIGGDSWFYYNVFPGTGIGVISEIAATATPSITAAQFRTLIQSAGTSQGRNRTYLQRMSYPQLSVVNGFSLIEAFAARDNISPDTTAFSGSNKNGDNPSIWSIATSSVPNKNDIIDVSGHLRRESTAASMTAPGKLWMFASVSKLGTGGDSYTDIEIYRTVPVLNLATGKLTNTGPATTGGHTSFTFLSTGEINSPGDIIICMNYGTGGGVASVKIWCNINNLDGNGNGITWFNSSPNRPFNFTGDFMIGSGTNGYGYAEISSLSGAPCLVYGVLNSTTSTAGAWGNLSSSSATFDANIQPEQLVNVAFNFTDMGLDFTTLAGPCENVFGALFFKTRSSSSYSSELKDCSGPYIFANFSEIQANAGPDMTLNCSATQIALNGSSATPGAIINWSTPNGNIVSGASTATPVVNQPGIYIMSAQSPGLSSCIATDTVIVTRNTSIPNANAGIDQQLTCGQTSIILNGTTTTPGALFSWNAINGGNIVSGASTATPLVNAAGCYVLTVTRPDNGCIATDTVCVILNISAPSVTGIVVTNVPCFALCNGSISFTVTGEQSPYTYNWSNGASTSSISDVCAGTYTVTVTGSNGCTTAETFNLNQPSATLVSSATSTQSVSCTGGSNGVASASATGGSVPYSYLWNSGSVTSSVSGLTAGNYTVTVTDVNGCTSQSNVTITQPASAISASLTVGQNVFCFGGSNASVDLTPAGGTIPYNYFWNNGSTNQDLIDVTAGTYTVTVTDANGCTTVQSAVISQPAAALSSSLNVSQHVSCFNGNNGALVLSVSNGTAPYTYLWSNGSTSSSLNGVTSGTYTVTITDANGCTNVRTATIAQPAAAITPSVSSTVAVSCFGGNNGLVNLTVTGGTAPYSYSWNNGASTQDINGLSNGTYTVLITDNNGCTATAQATITQPTAALGVNVSSAQQVSCFAGSNGSVNLTVNGGTAPYTYVWSNGSITQNISGLGSGTYTVTVTDANGCTATQSRVITQPTAALSTTANVSQNVSCFGGNNGSVNLTVTGGTTPYTYNWSNGDTTEDLNGISSGSYTVMVADVNGCTVVRTVTINQPSAALSATASLSQAVSCNSGNDGQITLGVSGGTSPYSYDWSNGSITAAINGLSTGTYTVTVTDANGCLATSSATVTQPSAALSGTTTVTSNISCFSGNNGSVDLTVSGGTSPYTFMWNTGSVSEDLNNLPAGSYSVTITDINGCIATAIATITQPSGSLSANLNVSQNVACYGGGNGSLDLTVTGGTSPYNYNWSTGATTQDISGLALGTYTVSITDANGCESSATGSITQPSAPLNAVVGSSVDVLCFGGNNGSINLTVTGGTIPYSYMWSNGSVSQDINNLNNGTYTVSITDANGCTFTQTAIISQPSAQLSSSAAVTANVLCFAGNNGSIDLTVTGGTSPYTFNWNNGAVTEDITNLSAGTYTVNISDANGCTSTATAQVTEPSASLSSSVNATQNVNCFNGNNGSIDMNVIGGTAPYTFNWSNGETTEDIANLGSGIYTVSVTDANGCTSGNTVTISQPQAALTSSISGTIDVSCFGGNNGIIDLSVAGGTLPYNYNWSNGETTEDISNLTAGTYSVSVTDANGCATSATVTINEPATALTPVISSAVQINCFGDETGSIDLNVIGGTAPYSYSWNTGDTTEDIDSLFAGMYAVIVTDVNGCEATATTTLLQPNAPLLALATVTSNVLCYGGSNGAIDVTVNGGTAPYSFLWNNSVTTEDISGLSTGIYTVTILDVNGCTITVSAGIGQPAQQLNASATIQDVLCFNGNNGFIHLIPSGGTTPYSYTWSNGSTTEDLGGLVAGVYSVTITDANGCDTLITSTIIQPVAPLIPAPTVDNNVSCYGGNDGAMSVTVTGGTQPYIYIWNNGQTSTSITSLTAGQYTLTVTDANGCNAIISDFVNQPAASLTTLLTVSQDVSCYGGSNGALTTNTTGGTAPYTYVWNTGAMTPEINNVSAGTYTVTITDSKGCTYSVSGMVSQPTAPLSMTGNATIANCLYGIGGDIAISVNGGTPGYSYSWSNGSTSQNILNALPGSYTVTVTDAYGCTLTNTYSIGNDSEAELQTGPAIICIGDFTTLWVDSIAGATYQWYFTGQPLNGATAPSFTTPAAGYYFVTITTVCGTFQTDSVEIQVKSVENATVSSNQIICPPEMVKLHASGGVTYEWTPSKFISSNTSPSPIVAPIQTTTYKVEITNEWGCKALMSVEVAVACDTLFVPTGFSPNDDGVNDGYVIDHIENYPGNRLWIYNRWGNLIYKARDYKNDWNGVANVSGVYIGKKVPGGTYYYILDLNDGSKPRSGYLIIRY